MDHDDINTSIDLSEILKEHAVISGLLTFEYINKYLFSEYVIRDNGQNQRVKTIANHKVIIDSINLQFKEGFYNHLQMFYFHSCPFNMQDNYSMQNDIAWFQTCESPLTDGHFHRLKNQPAT